MAKINELGFELVLHPPYSPDLASSDRDFDQIKSKEKPMVILEALTNRIAREASKC